MFKTKSDISDGHNNEHFYNCIKIRLLKKFSFYSFSSYVRSVPFYLMPVFFLVFVINNH